MSFTHLSALVVPKWLYGGVGVLVDASFIFVCMIGLSIQVVNIGKGDRGIEAIDIKLYKLLKMLPLISVGRLRDL